MQDEFALNEIYSSINDLIQPSASVVVFSQFLNPLAELREYVTIMRLGTFTRLEELWTREYQVLPMRTHPHMSMHGASGFLLSFVKTL